MKMKWLRIPPFTTIWVSISFLATYVFVLALVIYAHEALPSVPDQKGALEAGINLDAAWEDLQKIAQKPHPYNSKENDRVRQYILIRVQALAKKYNNIHISDDHFSTTMWVEDGNAATYFEGSNILVKVIGANRSLPSVLFSAHFDSAATAPGATDDGIAVVTLMSLIEQFAQKPPARTTIFNLNNGEEDSLCGSHAFFSHPWSKEPTIFLNLEGAGAGGRPILFRSSSAQLTRSFQNTGRPHGTVTSSDAFSLGLVRSQTDFEVYATEGEMKGLDVSFYTSRDKYHTMQDTIENLGGKAPLWAMLQLSRDVGFSLANIEDEEGNEQAVYWDILGSKMVVFDLTDFISTLSGTFVALTLLIIILLVYTIYTRRITLPSRGWAIFPFSLITGISMCSFLTFTYCFLNPLIIYSVTYPVMLSYSAGFILSLLLPCHFFFKSAQYHPIAQRTMVLLQYWGFTAILKLAYYQLLRQTAFGGFYFIEYFYLCASLSLIVHILGRVWSERSGNSRATQPSRRYGEPDDVSEPLLSGIPLLSRDYGFIQERDSNSGANTRPRNTGVPFRKDKLWILELLIATILPLILVLQLALVVCAGLGQTLADGSSPSVVYGGLGVLLFLSFLPFTPFAHQISTGIFIVTGTVFFWSTFYSVVCFPFASDTRLKFFYSHHLDLDTGNSSMSLAGVQPYLRQALWLPIHLMADKNISAHQKTVSKMRPLWHLDWSQDAFLNATVKWSQDPLRGLPMATWGTENIYIPLDTELFAKSGDRALVATSARRIDAETAIFTVKGKGSKSCTITFDENVIDVHVKRVGERDSDNDSVNESISSHRTSVDISPNNPDAVYPMPAGGVPKVTLWSREWDTEFEIRVRWMSPGIEDRQKLPWRSLLASLYRPVNASSRSWPSRTGRIGCNWADNSNDQLPAFDELGEVLPDWATLTTKRPLLTADRKFSV